MVASLCLEHEFEARGLSSCGTWAQLPRGMQDYPRPGIELMFPALAGGFLTTGPQGSPHRVTVWVKQMVHMKL